MGIKIVFFGTPQIARSILHSLIEKNANIVAVVTTPDKPVGRSGKLAPSSVKQLAVEKGLPLYQPRKASVLEFAQLLEKLHADLFVVVAYGEIFKENLLEMPRLGCINVHASLLPKYRGAAPIQRCIMAGEKESGVTIMRMTPELDAGDMLAVVKTPVGADMTAGELFIEIEKMGAEALWNVIESLEKGDARPIQQDSREASYARKLCIEDGEVDWKKPAKEHYDQIRGVTPKPGAWCNVEIGGKSKRLLIKKARLSLESGKRRGEHLSNRELLIACEGGGSIQLLEIQLEGKKTLTVHDFLKGTPVSNIKF
ncbi:MAG: methionyl-tRNA formyltransferase [Chlamydiales bacterium]